MKRKNVYTVGTHSGGLTPQAEEALYESYKLLVSLRERKLSVRKYLGAAAELTAKHYLEGGQVFDTLEEAGTELGKYFDDKIVARTIDHEQEHAANAKRYGVSVRFIFNPVTGTVGTWYANLVEEANDWSLKRLKDFLFDGANVTYPDIFDCTIMSTLRRSRNTNTLMLANGGLIPC